MHSGINRIYSTWGQLQRRYPYTAKFHRRTLIPALLTGSMLWTPVAVVSAQTPRCENWAAKLVSLEGRAKWRAQGTVQWHNISKPVARQVYFCAGDTLIVEKDRAALRLPNETVVRLKEKTTLKFFAPKQSFFTELLDGAAHFITRTPRRFDVQTPYLNAAVDGTEFLLSHAPQGDSLAVFEGRVSVGSKWGISTAETGQQIFVANGTSPHHATAIKLRDSAAWTLYFPPLPAPDNTPKNIRQALENGRIKQAQSLLKQLGAKQQNADSFALRASLSLYGGRVEEARQLLAQALAEEADNPTAQALQSLQRLLRGERRKALASAEALVARWPGQAGPWLALSYAQQSHFQLQAALASVKKAAAIRPDSGLVQARLAALRLMLGDYAGARETIERTLQLSPALSRAYTVQGFSNLNRLALSTAQNAFATAAQLDPADPLPRLALGIIAIRRGQLAAGREQIELATALDPGNSLIRSYLGKAYYEENRNSLAVPQYDVAIDLDTEDPTPWFYRALLKQSENQLLPALDDLEAAIARSDNRAVYRSRLLLDSDTAARGASQARIYNALAFNRLAVFQGATAISRAPQEHSGHRLLAQAYNDKPRFENLRASERLQARLLQPLGATPLPLGLGEPGLLVQPGAGPGELGLNEFNSLFVQEGLSGLVSALAGSRDTKAYDWRFGALYGRGAFELSQYQYRSDGFRDNNDVDYEISNAFGQLQVSEALRMQLELRRREDEQGDVVQRFFEDSFYPHLREMLTADSAQLGLTYQFTPSSQIIGLIAAENVDTEFSNLFMESFGDFALGIEEKTESEWTEIQYQFNREKQHWLAGINYFDNEKKRSTTSQFTPPFGPPPPPPVPDSNLFENHYSNAYIYTFLQQKSWDFTFGLAYANYNSDELEEDDKLNPKLGINWFVTPRLQLRASAFKTLARPFELKASLEPSHLAGFPQLFDDVYTSLSEFGGIGLDYESQQGMRMGFEAGSRDIEEKIFEDFSPVEELNRITEISTKTYFYYPITPQLSFAAELNMENYRKARIDNIDISIPIRLKTFQLPLQFTFFASGNSSISLTARHTHQTAAFLQPDDSLETNKSKFWTIDFGVNYRLPNRIGLISLEARNLLDEKFEFQDINFQTTQARPQQITPRRMLQARITIYF